MCVEGCPGGKFRVVIESGANEILEKNGLARLGNIPDKSVYSDYTYDKVRKAIPGRRQAIIFDLVFPASQKLTFTISWAPRFVRTLSTDSTKPGGPHT